MATDAGCSERYLGITSELFSQGAEFLKFKLLPFGKTLSLGAKVSQAN